MTLLLKLLVLTTLIYVFYKIIGVKKITKLTIFDLILIILVSLQYVEVIYFDINFLKIIVTTSFIFLLQFSLWLFKYQKKQKSKIIIYKNHHLFLINVLKNNITIFNLVDFLKENRFTSLKQTSEIWLLNGILSLKEEYSKDKPLFLITNGKINYNNLALIDKNYNWLINNIDTDLEKIVCSFYQNDYLYVIKDNSLNKNFS